MVTAQAVFKEVLSSIKPSDQEVRSLDKLLRAFAKKIAIHGTPVEIGGSTAKNTWLRGNHDADFFVKFNYKQHMSASDQLSDKLHKHLLKLKFRPTRVHGSRDYFQVEQQGYTFEIIPILNISSAKQAKNITDASPLHAKWVVKFPQYSDDIRLAKQFCKAQDIYGAESFIGGFSGYVLEILVIAHKGFLPLLRAATKWKPHAVIDYAKHHKNALLEVNKSKTFGPLIVIDPVEPGRNAAAAVSPESFTRFITAANQFLAKPSTSFFTIEKKDTQSLRATFKKYGICFLDLTLKPGKRDVVGCRVTRLLHLLTQSFTKNTFVIKDHGYFWKDNKHATIYVVIDEKKLPLPTKILNGPPQEMAKHVAAFRKKHKTAKLVKKRWQATIATPYTNPSQLVKDFLKTPHEGISAILFNYSKP